MGGALKRTIMLFLVAILLTGCWDRREPEELVPVLALGFDMDEEGFYEVVAQLSNPSAIGGGGAGGDPTGGTAGGGRGTKRTFWTHSVKGHTPFEAIRNLALTTTRLISLSHLEFLLLSEKLARHGIGPIIDLFERERQLRLSVHVAIVEGDLKELLDAEFPLEMTAAMGLSRLFRLLRAERSVITEGPLLAKIVLLERPGEEMTLPRVKLLQSEGPNRSKGSSPSPSPVTSPGPPAEVSGGAAFRGEKMVGWLDIREARGWNWITGRGQRGPILVKTPGVEGLVTIDLLGAKSTVEPVVEGDRIRMRVKVKAWGRVQDQTTPEGDGRTLDLRDPEAIRSLRRRFSAVLRNDMEMAIARAQELGSDIFGFGNAVYRKHPRVWKEFAAERWDEIFKTIPVDITVETVVVRPGLVLSSTTAPRGPREGE